MNDIFLLNLMESIGNVEYKLFDEFFVKAVGCEPEQLVQISMIAKFIDDKGEIGCFKNIIDPDYVWEVEEPLAPNFIL